MIDYFALALGHALLVLVFARLVVRDSLDVDPAIAKLREEAKTKRPNSAQRRASRKAAARTQGEAEQ